MEPIRLIGDVVLFPVRALGLGWKGATWLRKRWKLFRRPPAFGSNRLATQRELRGGEGYPLGILGRTLVRTHRESCVLMFGARGAGKSLTLGATLHHAAGSNFVIQDPPKQLWARFAAPLQAKGYRTIKIDLDDPESGLGYNPATYLDASTSITRDRDIRDIANLLVADVETSGRTGSHFRDMAALFIKGVLGWLDLHDQANASPYGVAKLLLLNSEEQQSQAFTSMLNTGDDSLRLAINVWRSVGQNEGGSFKSTLTNALEAWTWRSLRALTDRKDTLHWEQELTGEQPCAVFLCGGVLGADTSKHLVRLFFGQAAGSLARLYATSGRLPRDTRILIDEGSVVGRCKPLVQTVAELRKAGVSTFICYQSPSQLYQCMGQEDGGTIFSNSDLVFSGGLKSPQDYEVITKLAGSHTVNPITRGREVSLGEASRPLLSADELFKLDADRLAVVLGNRTAIIKRAYRITRSGIRY